MALAWFAFSSLFSAERVLSQTIGLYLAFCDFDTETSLDHYKVQNYKVGHEECTLDLLFDNILKALRVHVDVQETRPGLILSTEGHRAIISNAEKVLRKYSRVTSLATVYFQAGIESPQGQVTALFRLPTRQTQPDHGMPDIPTIPWSLFDLFTFILYGNLEQGLTQVRCAGFHFTSSGSLTHVIFQIDFVAHSDPTLSSSSGSNFHRSLEMISFISVWAKPYIIIVALAQ